MLEYAPLVLVRIEVIFCWWGSEQKLCLNWCCDSLKIYGLFVFRGIWFSIHLRKPIFLPSAHCLISLSSQVLLLYLCVLLLSYFLGRLVSPNIRCFSSYFLNFTFSSIMNLNALSHISSIEFVRILIRLC